MQTQHRFRTLFAAILWVATFCAVARAEIISRIPGDFGWRKSLPLHLILEKEVVEDLQLSAAATQDLKQLHEQIQKEVETERSRGDKTTPSASRPERFVRIDPWNEATLHAARNRHGNRLNDLLTSPQQERLYEIHLQKQRKPTDALCDPQVTRALELSDAQRSEIFQRHREVVKAEMDEVKLAGKYQGPRSSDLEERCPEAVLMILTDGQRQAFEKMRGQPLRAAARERDTGPED